MASTNGFHDPGQEDGGAKVLIGRMISALRRFKWLVLGITILGTGGTVVATRFITPNYVVQSTIWVGGGGARNGPIQAPGLLHGFQWIELITSYAVRDNVVRELKLYLTPGSRADSTIFQAFQLDRTFRPGKYVLKVDEQRRAWVLDGAGGIPVASGAVGDSIGRDLGFLWAPDRELLRAGQKVPFTIVTPREASNQVGNSFRARMTDEDANFIHLTFNDPDAHHAANVLNALAAEFVQTAAQLKKEKLTELSRLLYEQVTLQEAALRGAEQSLESFKVNTITLPNENSQPVSSGLAMTQPTVIGMYFNMRIQEQALRQDREAIEDLLARAQKGDMTVDAFLLIPSVRGSQELSRVLAELATVEADLRLQRQRYTDDHRIIKDLLLRQDLLRNTTVPLYTRALIAQLKGQEADLSGRLAGSTKELKEIPVRAATEARLRRDQDAALILFRNLQGRYEEAKLAEMSSIPDVKTLVEAVPPTRPTKNTAPRLILMGFGASLATALALAILLDRIDRRFRYPEQVTQELRLSILGAIPVIRREHGNGVMAPEETAQIVEAFRSVRLNLAHAFEDGPISLAISSPGPGDGKSLISSNLALAFAEAGYRTILVDGDTRRGELHRTFQVERRPGLLDYLLGSATFESLIRPTSHALLSVVPGGTRTHRGPELLGSNRMMEVMAKLKQQYEVIIVDTPPLGVGIDPFVIGTMTGHMVLVLRSGETDRQMAEARLHTLDRLPIRVLGAILNDIRPGAGAYRYYSYLYGYTAEDEVPVGADRTAGILHGAS